MNTEQVLTSRFMDAIKRGVSRPVLIGPKWFKYNPKGKPAYFQFIGCCKLAKALKKKPDVVAKMLVDNLQAADLDVDVAVTSDYMINVNPKKAKADESQ